MSTGNQRRTRSDLVSGLRLPPGQAERFFTQIRRPDVWFRIGLALLAAVAMWAATFAWAPRFAFRTGYVPPRDIVAKIPFSVHDENETESRRRIARSQTLAIYRNSPQPLVEFRQAMKDAVFQIMSRESFETLAPKDQAVWSEFLRQVPGQTVSENAEQLFNDLREALADDTELKNFEKAVATALVDFERNGLLVNLQHDLGEGSQTHVMVYDEGQEDRPRRVEVKDIRIAEATADLRQRMAKEFETVGLPGKHIETVSQLVLNWINHKKLPTTLSWDTEATRAAQDLAAANVEDAMRRYEPGDPIAKGQFPLVKADVDLLLSEYRTQIASMPISEKIRHSVADLGMYIALYVLCGSYVYFHARSLLTDLYRLSTMLALVVVTVTLCMFASGDQWRAESIPLILYGTTVAIAYQREVALLLSSAVALVVALSTGQGLAEFVILVASVAAAVLLVGRIRSRTKLLYVGLGAGAVAALTTVGVGTLLEQPYGWSGLAETPFGSLDEMIYHSFTLRLIGGALWYGCCAVLSGILMTGVLPFIERIFDVQTDISLLELGDAAHPLLQELVRRAPGTYNHSITVASIAEAAAEAIGANGLLVRVGAYFHDIGKMLKPAYFVENQERGNNRHESLVPAMSTLVIIAHVKDGADLARKHHLPRSIINFIEQHHGTTLVEYFYREATKRSENDPDSSDVDETSFRYPGPKPQSKEAGVMMLADASESACRALTDPAPARIEHLVKDLAMKRLLDGQFDECGLTLRELRIIEEALIKSLTAVYHGRVKYPSQQTA